MTFFWLRMRCSTKTFMNNTIPLFHWSFHNLNGKKKIMIRVQKVELFVKQLIDEPLLWRWKNWQICFPLWWCEHSWISLLTNLNNLSLFFFLLCLIHSRIFSKKKSWSSCWKRFSFRFLLDDNFLTLSFQWDEQKESLISLYRDSCKRFSSRNIKGLCVFLQMVTANRSGVGGIYISPFQTLNSSLRTSTL